MQNTFQKIQHQKALQTRRFKRWRSHPLAAAITLFVLLVGLGSMVLVIFSRQQTVTFHPDTSFIAIISHDSQTQTVPTNEPTVRALLQKLNIRVNKLDRVEPSLNTAIDQDNFRVNVYRALPVTITDGITTTTAFTAAATPRSIVTEAGVQMYPEDRAMVAPAEDIVAQQSVGQDITIERSVPLTLTVYGTPLSIRTITKTVGQLLQAKHVVVNPKDTIVPAAGTPITPGMQIYVIRNGTQIVTAAQSIPAPVQTVTDPSLSFGTSAIRQQGSPGTQVLTYQINTEHGVEVSRTLLQTVVTVQPVPQIVAKGQAVTIPADKQAVMAQAGIASSDYAYVDYIMSHEGGWCPTKVQGQHDCPGYPPDPVPSYGGYGIGQATPGSKMAAFGSDWETNVVTQLKWATSYAGRYGGWAGAYNHWVANHNW